MKWARFSPTDSEGRSNNSVGPRLVYDQNHYFGLGPIPKPKLADTFWADTVTDTETTFQMENLVTNTQRSEVHF